jgi:hypothetical protein
MADRFYYCEFGADKIGVTEAGVDSAGADVSVRITYDATNNSKQATLKALEQIKARIVQDTWPPA